MTIAVHIPLPALGAPLQRLAYAQEMVLDYTHYSLVMQAWRRVAVSYAVEAVRIFDHYHFRAAQLAAQQAQKKLQLARSPRSAGEKHWWSKDYTDARKIRDLDLFA